MILFNAEHNFASNVNEIIDVQAVFFFSRSHWDLQNYIGTILINPYKSCQIHSEFRCFKKII